MNNRFLAGIKKNGHKTKIQRIQKLICDIYFLYHRY